MENRSAAKEKREKFSYIFIKKIADNARKSKKSTRGY